VGRDTVQFSRYVPTFHVNLLDPPKRCCLPTKIHGITSQKVVMFFIIIIIIIIISAGWMLGI
jgi:hypothetical protein